MREKTKENKKNKKKISQKIHSTYLLIMLIVKTWSPTT